MNQSKFSLADLITLLAALAFGFICFLGANFYTLGDITKSIILAVSISVLLGGTAIGAKWLKRTDGNFKTCFVWEIILLILLTGLTGLFTYSVFSHYFVVSEQKNAIKNKLTASITQAENMFSKYEEYAETRKDLYRHQLRSAVINEKINPSIFANFGFQSNNNAFNQNRIEDIMRMVHADLYPSNFKDMKTADSTWLAKSKGIVENWKPIGVVDVMKNVEQNSIKSKNELVKFSDITEHLENKENFKYTLQFENVKKHFTTLGNPTTISIGLAAVAYLLMLLSYLISKRSTKTTICIKKNKGDFDVEY